MAEQEPWIRAEMGGTKRALIISKPEVLGALLRKAKRPLIILGTNSVSGTPETDFLISAIKKLHDTRNIPVISTGHIMGDLIARGFTPSASLGSMEITDRLCDPSWKGLDGKGQYDLVFIAGFSYTLGGLILSGLKQGTSGMKIISLDPKYHPHATWSYSNMKTETWKAEMEQFIQILTPEKDTENTNV